MVCFGWCVCLVFSFEGSELWCSELVGGVTWLLFRTMLDVRFSNVILLFAFEKFPFYNAYSLG